MISKISKILKILKISKTPKFQKLIFFIEYSLTMDTLTFDAFTLKEPQWGMYVHTVCCDKDGIGCLTGGTFILRRGNNDTNSLTILSMKINAGEVNIEHQCVKMFKDGTYSLINDQKVYGNFTLGLIRFIQFIEMTQHKMFVAVKRSDIDESRLDATFQFPHSIAHRSIFTGEIIYGRTESHLIQRLTIPFYGPPHYKPQEWMSALQQTTRTADDSSVYLAGTVFNSQPHHVDLDDTQPYRPPPPPDYGMFHPYTPHPDTVYMSGGVNVHTVQKPVETEPKTEESH